MVDGRSTRIRGRIDRIDRHPEHGLRVIDYKTGERARRPEQVHFRLVDGRRIWTDLQLPLYRYLLDASQQGGAGPVEVGFVSLTQDLARESLSLVAWAADVDDEALDVARDVVRQVRAGRFWPPADAPPFDDGLRSLTGERWEGRALSVGG